ncbi:MAG: glycosyltransferase family 2 protein [Bacteroidetes bacterium]|nr:MAG: glycosyltransferase family 2 protein [Bacteroidota bacterium]
MLIIEIIQIIFLVYLGFATLYIFVFGFASLFPSPTKKNIKSKFRRYAVLIPGYKEDQVIIEVAKDALMQDYAGEMYDIIVIADSFKEETLETLRKLPIQVIEVSFDLSTKAKALNKAMDQLPNNYDVALILDADNLMEPEFILKINEAFNKGFVAVQGHRVAKNTNTPFAILDAISEEVNNNIFRKGHRVLGFSSALIGSGMAFDYNYFKKIMKSIEAVGGFDKEIELQILKGKIRIEFLDSAIVYDEKVQKAEVFSNQRRRWLSAQLHYFSVDFYSSIKHFFLYGNYDYLDKIIQFIQPPRVLLLGLLMMINVISVFLNPIEWVYIWFGVLAICILTFIFTIPAKFYNFNTIKAVFTLPKVFFLMFLSLLRIKGANKKFIHTEHGSVK